MKCRICGYPLDPSHTFCRNCGASNATETVISHEVLNSSIKPQKEINFQRNESENKFLVILGVIITIIALMTVIYLIYSTLKIKGNKQTNSSVVVLTPNSYYVTYKNHTFTLTPDIKVKIYDDILELASSNYKTRIRYESGTYDLVNIDLIKESYKEKNEYVLNEPLFKNDGNNSYYITDIDYNEGLKSSLIIMNSKDTGYWILEIGGENYPSSEAINEVLKIINSSKIDESESKLNLELKLIDKTQINDTN